MVSRNVRRAVGLLLLLGFLGGPPFVGPHVAVSEEPAAQKRTVVREIFVPFEDLNVLLESSIQRIFLSRKEYEELLDKAKKTPAEPSLRRAILVASDYHGKIEEGRAVITGNMTVSVYSTGCM